MEVDYNVFKKGFACVFQIVLKTVLFHLYASFLKTGKYYKLYPAALSIFKKLYYWFSNGRFKGILQRDANTIWKIFPEPLCIAISEKLNSIGNVMGTSTEEC